LEKIKIGGFVSPGPGKRQEAVTASDSIDPLNILKPGFRRRVILNQID
jgi:hypothetical protein